MTTNAKNIHLIALYSRPPRNPSPPTTYNNNRLVNLQPSTFNHSFLSPLATTFFSFLPHHELLPAATFFFLTSTHRQQMQFLLLNNGQIFLCTSLLPFLFLHEKAPWQRHTSSSASLPWVSLFILQLPPLLCNLFFSSSSQYQPHTRSQHQPPQPTLVVGLTLGNPCLSFLLLSFNSQHMILNGLDPFQPTLVSRVESCL